MVKKTTKAMTNVLEVVKAEVVKPVKKSGFFKYFVITLVLASALYLLKDFFIAAVVNGKPIFRMQLATALEKRYGKQGLDELISKNIILGEAKSRDIKVNDAEIQTEIDRIKTLVESQGSTLDDALLAQGQTMADLRENIKIQKLVEHLLGGAVDVSEDEAKKYFEDNKATFGEDAKFEDVKDELISSLKQQKMGTEFDKWLADKKSSAKIMYFGSFK